MATCKDCIYEPRCIGVISYGMDCDDATGKIIDDIENRCKHFKDRSRIIELPCNVGDTVYFIETRREKQGKRNVYTDFIECGVVDRFIIGESNILMADICTSENRWYGIEAKTVFLTKEEAEQALKERENNGRQ